MDQDINRFMLELDKARRDINRQVLKPRIARLSVKQLEPMIRCIALARADYIEVLLSLASGDPAAPPSAADIERLKQKREAFNELLQAANALETIIQRDYIHIAPQKNN